MAKPGYSWTKFGYTWGPKWQVTENGQTQNVEDFQIVQQAFQDPNVEPQQKAAIEAAEREMKERKQLPYGDFRNQVTMNQASEQYVKELENQNNGYEIPKANIYIHLADPDSTSFKVSPDPNFPDSNALFDRYEDIINNRNDRDTMPDLISGGYALKPGQGGVDPEDKLTELTGKIDMSVRQVLASANPTLPYYPEPNTLVRYESLLDDNSPTKFIGGKDGPFGKKSGEGNKLKGNIFNRKFGRKLPTDTSSPRYRIFQNTATFEPSAAIPTGTTGQGERFKPSALPNYLKALLKTETGEIPDDVMRAAIAAAYRSIFKGEQNHAKPHTLRGKLRSLAPLILDNQKSGGILIYVSAKKPALQEAIKAELENSQPFVPSPQLRYIESVAQGAIDAIAKYEPELQQLIRNIAQNPSLFDKQGRGPYREQQGRS